MAALAIALALLPTRETLAAEPTDVPAPALELGVSPCALVEGLPAPSHPVRRAPALAGAFKALDQAGQDPARNAQALAQLTRALDKLYQQAERAFKAPPEGRTFATGPAQRFLSAHVLAANAPLRVGLERFEPAPPVAAALALAACRAGKLRDAIDLARASSMADSSELRAFAALLLIVSQRLDEARELLPRLGDAGFLAAFVRAELAPPAERRDHHLLAGRRRATSDQDLAWQLQARRIP